jgi:hypothetical protein
VKVEFTCLQCGYRTVVDEPGFVAQESWIRCPRCEAVIAGAGVDDRDAENELPTTADAERRRAP